MKNLGTFIDYTIRFMPEKFPVFGINLKFIHTYNHIILYCLYKRFYIQIKPEWIIWLRNATIYCCWKYTQCLYKQINLDLLNIDNDIKQNTKQHWNLQMDIKECESKLPVFLKRLSIYLSEIYYKKKIKNGKV